MQGRGPWLTRQERFELGLLDQALGTPAGRRSLLALVVCALLLYAGYRLWQADRYRSLGAPSGPTVRIATWNMHVFSVRAGIDLDKIAGIIRENGLDVVALQEVREAGAEVDRLVNTLGPPWRATQVSAETGNHEYFEFIYNGAHVREIGSAHTVASVLVTKFNRWPYQASFEAGHFRFTLITAHLYYGKSDRETWRIDPRDLERRRAEAEALARIASNLEATSQINHVIVLGDFNEQRADGFLHYFEDQGWERLISDATNLSSTETFDNILIDPRITREWRGRSGAVHFDQTDYPGDRRAAVEAVSDHRPAWADFATDMGAPPTTPAVPRAPPADW